MINIQVRDANNWSISFNVSSPHQLTVQYICSRVQAEHPQAPVQSQCRLIWGGRVLEHDQQVRDAFQPTAEPQPYRVYLVVSAAGNQTPQIGGSFGQPQSPPIIRFDERSQDAAMHYILDKAHQQLPGSPPDPHLMELNRSFTSILGSERARTLGSPLSGSQVYSPSAEPSSLASDEDNDGEAPAEGAELVNGDGGDNQAGAGDGNANNNNGVGGNRRQVRWLDFGVLTRLAVGFMLLSQGSGGPECFFFVGFGIVYYLFETGILEDVMARYLGEEEAEGENNGEGEDNGNNDNDARPVPPVRERGEGVDVRGGLRRRLRRTNRYYYTLYREGFPVPQAPGLLLDTFSFMMALCASLKPGWDPRPVNPHFFRGQPAPADPGAGAGAAPVVA